MADAERLEIRYQRGRLVEAELRRELEPVGCERDGGQHHPAPMLQNTDQAGNSGPGSPPQIGRSGRKLRGWASSPSERVARSLSVSPSPSAQSATREEASNRAATNLAPANRGTISRRRTASKSRTSASRLPPSEVAGAPQSSTAMRNVFSSSGSGIARPNSA